MKTLAFQQRKAGWYHELSDRPRGRKVAGIFILK
jgi:hypothetical protein